MNWEVLTARLTTALSVLKDPPALKLDLEDHHDQQLIIDGTPFTMMYIPEHEELAPVLTLDTAIYTSATRWEPDSVDVDTVTSWNPSPSLLGGWGEFGYTEVATEVAKRVMEFQVERTLEGEAEAAQAEWELTNGYNSPDNPEEGV